MELGVTLGADVPFCLYNRPARVQGIGEDIRGIEVKKKYHVLLIKPEEGVSTAEVFKAYKPGQNYDIDELENRLREGRKLSLGNALEQPAMEILPRIKTLKQQCLDLGYGDVLMSGSGSCVFVLSTRKSELNKIYSYMKNIYSFVIMSEIKAF
jgi:4-diphosphocytidyl-2C-methyl-D-erythritol kinase